MERPKRCVAKPSRYQMTSSDDEAPKRRRSIIEMSNATGNIDLDINELRTHLLQDEDSSMDEQNEPNYSNTLNNISIPKHTYTYTPTHSQNMSRTHIPSFLSLENNLSQSHTHTNPTHNYTLIDNTHSRKTNINKLQETQLPEEERSETINTERSFDKSNNL